MKKKSREISIFSMSALDLFASALGAFILLAVIALPYFGNLSPLPVQAQEACPEPKPCPEQKVCEVCQSCPEPKVCPICQTCQEPIQCPKCPEPSTETATTKLVDNLIVIEMSWRVSADIDLYVIAPSGDEFYYGQPTIRGVPGVLTLDNIEGPVRAGQRAMEIWKVFNPMPGEYQICIHYHITQGNSNPSTVRVNTRLDKPTGPVEIPETRLRRNERRCIYKFSMDSDYTFIGAVL